MSVRQGDIVPDRPIRISFRLEYNGAFAQWKLLSVEELPAGVASKALDWERDFPKVSRWPQAESNRGATALVSDERNSQKTSRLGISDAEQMSSKWCKELDI
jgi:hypothetical protein